ncbi:hypothetical protein K402DRAFT_389419 [Aulographum hederae CBS 113979]|uniref:HypA-like protein n=1 Tax=Aulographum hederae CBS 113979 TaxID=1176131 RepID=A0A6G1HDY9_9PEZI|nr:hypothetical protein K402DRAFT_389419 [Aulographum hederae CBS 113979]
MPRDLMFLPPFVRFLKPPIQTSSKYTSRRQFRRMATASIVKLSTAQEPQFFLKGRTQEATDRTSQLLQENHYKHHIFFNRSGFHNHIVHHLLTVYALAANPEQIQKHYDENASYQRPPEPVQESVVKDMSSDKFNSYLGNERYYHDFLVFFQTEMDSKGWQAVVNEYVFSGSKLADDMLVRMFGGFLHPIIHLGFGIEFEQPAIIAEALSQAAVHDNWMAPLFFGAENAAKENAKRGTKPKTLVQLLDEIRANEKLLKAAHWGDGNKIRDGVMARAGDEMIKNASQYFISDSDNLDKKTAEMINAAAYFTGGAQHPPNQIKFDFYYMHSINAALFFPRFLHHPSTDFISPAAKIRLLEWKSRNDLAMYASRAAPALLVDEITDYQPKTPGTWDRLFDRVNEISDDGHVSKLVRALATGEDVCEPFQEKKAGEIDWRIRGDMWLQLGHMVVDSTEGSDTRWVRSAGFDEAWENIPKRDEARL